MEEKIAKELESAKEEVGEETTPVTKEDDKTESGDAIEETKLELGGERNAGVEEAEIAKDASMGTSEPRVQKQPPPPPPPQQWEQQQQEQPYYDSYGQPMDPYALDQQQQQYESDLFYLQEELTESLTREHSLVSQLDNLTRTALALEQREELHKHQLDVLTERVVDVEARSADDRTLLIEYEVNCTALGATILGLQEDLEEWQERCQEWSQKHEADQEKLDELKRAIKEKVSEAEDLAIAMEELRITEERRRQDVGKANAKKGGLVSWVFGWMGFGKSSAKSKRYDDEVREDAFELAKSTLLRALQSERTNVHELEAAVASLQQNNSAISEMVESRDNIIDELNSRIAVFEEDKVVLKAALRQLQKEMKEEEPKTQKLIDDLAAAEEQVELVQNEVHSILATHQEELANLQATMSQKQKTITDAESNLTAIGTYVDKLEERLTSFAMTRRDMEAREKQCKEIEKAAEESEAQRKAMEAKVEEFESQEEELKKLLEELATERADLQKENRRLYTEQEFRIGEQEKLQTECERLRSEAGEMREQIIEWKEKCETLAPNLEALQSGKLELENQVETLTGVQKELNTLQIENAVVVEANEKLQTEVETALEENQELRAKLEGLAGELEAKERAERERLAAEQCAAAEAKEQQAKEEETKRRRPPPPTNQQNDVPLRTLRKTLSKATGLHGLLTPKSSSKDRTTTPRIPRPVGVASRSSERQPPRRENIPEDDSSSKSEGHDSDPSPPLPPPRLPTGFQQPSTSQ